MESMNDVELCRFEVRGPSHGDVPCAALFPSGCATSLPLCLFLYGGGGSRESLADIRPLVVEWFASGQLPPMVLATPDVGPWSFYLGWESFVVERLVPHLRARFALESRTGMVGISMGGYGALNIAFAHAADFAAVAAISPMIEPSFEANEVPLRNRYHYPPEVEQHLVRADPPVARARRYADRLSDLAIYVDAAGADVLHAHDGAEFLHRTLWDLDVAHEYRLRRDADHIGPDLPVRLFDAFAWTSGRLGKARDTSGDELERARKALHAQLEPLARDAALRDPTLSRRYGVLPQPAR
ncbi:MAG: alpha/beta hydrolase-fold protein [Polyangiales bacterium]